MEYNATFQSTYLYRDDNSGYLAYPPLQAFVISLWGEHWKFRLLVVLKHTAPLCYLLYYASQHQNLLLAVILCHWLISAYLTFYANIPIYRRWLFSYLLYDIHL